MSFRIREACEEVSWLDPAGALACRGSCNPEPSAKPWLQIVYD